MPEPIRPNLFGTTHKITVISFDGVKSDVEVKGPIVIENNKLSEELLDKILEKVLDYINQQENYDPMKSLDIELPFVNSGGDSVNSILKISFIKKGYKVSSDAEPFEKNILFILLFRDKTIYLEELSKETTNGMAFKYGYDTLTDVDKTEIRECIRLSILGADELTKRASARQGFNQARSIFDAQNPPENN